MRPAIVVRSIAMLLASTGVLAAELTVAHARPKATIAGYGCGSITADHGTRFHVSVTRGHVACSTARRVLRVFLNGGGKMHGPPSGPAYLQYWTLFGWSCGYGTGGGGCTRHHDRILAQSP
jgi:hypothetical protein